MVDVKRNLWRSSCFPALQDHLEPSSQDHDWMAFEHVQGWRLQNLPGQPVPALGYPHSKKVLPDVWMKPPVFQFVSIGSGPGH